MITTLLSPKDTLDHLFTGMRDLEIDAMRSRIANFNERIGANPTYISAQPNEDMITCATNQFIDEFGCRIQELKQEDHVKILEELIDRLSIKYLSFIRKLELGKDMGGMPWANINRLPINISKLIKLEKLFINNRPIEDLTPLSPLSLKFVCADSCPVSDISCMNFFRMNWFNLQGTNISDVHIFKNAPLIDWLRLEDTNITDFDQVEILASMDHVSEFGIKGCKLPMFPEKIGPFKQNGVGHYIVEDPTEFKKRRDGKIEGRNDTKEYEDHISRW